MVETVSMNGGNGPNSYTQNSKSQEEGSTRAKALLAKSIQENLEIQNNSRVFSIADLGCSVGPNTFSCVQTIMQAVQLKLKNCGPDLEEPEFHVFFNDNVTNDFNTLFKALPPERQYMAAGVPGSFHGRLFPKASMNFMHSSFALNWLAKVPKEVTQEYSSAWNKGRVSYVLSSREVMNAYAAQFSSDIEAFFSARSMELAGDGLLVVIMPCRAEGTLPSESTILDVLECLGDSLADMVKEGLVSEALVDSFNIPVYIPTASEVKEVVSSIKNLQVEKIEEIYYSPIKLSTREDVQLSNLHLRATTEGILCKHFGSELMNELFERHLQKLEDLSHTTRFARVKKMQDLFLLVKRKT